LCGLAGAIERDGAEVSIADLNRGRWLGRSLGAGVMCARPQKNDRYNQKVACTHS
jgi:hypothetical protein